MAQLHDDQSLMKYITEVFSKYDENNTKTIEPAELHWFLNDLLLRLGENRRYTPA